MDSLKALLQLQFAQASQMDRVVLAAAATAAALLALFVIRTLAGLQRWVVVAVRSRHIPVAPGGNLLLGHVLQLFPQGMNCPWERMLDWVREQPIVRFRIGTRTGLVVNDASAMKRIFQTRQRVYDKDLDFSYGPFLPILGTGLVTANGAQWQKQRLLMAPALRIDMLDAIIPVAKRAVDRLCKRLEFYRGTGEAVDMQHEFHLVTLQVIGEAILSLDPQECDRVFPKLYIPVMEESNNRVLAPWRRFYPTTAWHYNSRVRQLNSYLLDIIRARHNMHLQGGKPEDGDILDRVISYLMEQGEKWDSALETQMCYELKTFLLAGHETSAAMLGWSLYELTQSPQALQKLRTEAAPVFPQSDPEAVPTKQQVEDMQYAHSVLKESLRKYSVVPVVTRNLTADDELCGYKVPKGSWIICHLEGVHHKYKDPMAWRPERFMPGGEYDQLPEDLRLYYFLPFIQGPRNCLGQYFSLLESRVILGVLSQRFTFTPVDAAKQGITHTNVIPIMPMHGMNMIIT